VHADDGTIAGAALGLATLILQLILYLGWQNFVTDLHLTLTARNYAPGDTTFVTTLRDFYENRNIVFLYNLQSSDQFVGLFASLRLFFRYVLQTSTPFLSLIAIGMAIAALLAEQRGDFVTAAAGHHMESMLAAYGSGASKVSYAEDKRILNVDIGGGTTKLGIVEKGNVIATAALHIGGRLQVMEETGRIVRLDPAGKFHARQAGFSWSRGDVVSSAQLDNVATTMADLLVAALTQRPLPHAVEHLYLTDPIGELGRIDGVMFSGGVGEYVYGREQRDFADMGRRLGRAIRARIDAGALPWPLLPPGECIRATALGASEYSVQLSGNTSYISKPGELLPRRNLQVLQPPYLCEEAIDADKLAQAIRAHFTAFDLIEGEGEVALALRWQGAPSYERILAFAEGIRHGLARTIERRKPLYLMLDGDVAQTLGAILREELLVESEILAIDGLVLRDFDYIDLGRIRMPSFTVPVTIKSLLFSEDPRRGRPHQRIHHHDHDDAHRHGHHHDHGGHGHHHHHDHD